MLNLKMLSDGVGIKMLGVHEGRPGTARIYDLPPRWKRL